MHKIMAQAKTGTSDGATVDTTRNKPRLTLQRKCAAVLIVSAASLVSACSAGAPAVTPDSQESQSTTIAASSSESSSSSEDPGTQDPLAEDSVEPQVEGWIPATSYTARKELDGVDLRLTVEWAKPVRGNSSELQQVWEAAGGTGAAACSDETLGIWSQVRLEGTAFWVGRAWITNMTPGFDPPDPSWGLIASGSGQLGAQGPSQVGLGIGYGTANACPGTLPWAISAAWEPGSNQWGPVPITVAFNQVYTPSHPDGDYSFLEDTMIEVDSNQYSGEGGLKVKSDSGRLERGMALPRP